MLSALWRSRGRRHLFASLSELPSVASLHKTSHIVEKSENFEQTETLVGAYTPVTKKLWLQRYKWDEATLADAQPQTLVQPKPPNKLSVQYSFTTDAFLREHYRSPWGMVRLGRVLEDLDSFAGYIAYDHCDDGDPSTRPPLLVTAAVEAIHFRSSQLDLDQDMQMKGQVVWTGRSSVDVYMELVQAERRKLAALFTFVARDPLTNRAQPINPIEPRTEAEMEMFQERQRVAEGRKAARGTSGDSLHRGSPRQREWAAALLQQGRTKQDLPALADGNSILLSETSLENTFTAQPQQRNMHGRVFGGFLMRRAFELAHSTAYLFAGCRPRTEEVGEISFRRPVEVGDLIKFKSWVLGAWQSEEDPSRGCALIQVLASVTQPEKLHSYVTNTFNFEMSFELKKDEDGRPLPPPRVLPTTEEAALEIAKYLGPDAQIDTGNGFINMMH